MHIYIKDGIFRVNNVPETDELVNVSVLAIRSKALLYLENKTLSSYNPDEDLFKKIVKMRKKKEKDAYHGVEVLLKYRGELGCFFLRTEALVHSGKALKLGYTHILKVLNRGFSAEPVKRIVLSEKDRLTISSFIKRSM